MNRTYDIIIDISNPRQNIVSLKVGDQRATFFRFTIMNQGQKFDLSDAYLATVKGVKPDGTIIYADADIDKDNSIITYQVSDQATTVKGKCIYEVEITDDNLGIITSFDFYVSVECNTFNELDYLSTNDLSAFRAYMQQTQRNSDETRRYVNSFREAYGDEQVLINEQQTLYEEYQIYLNSLKSRVEAGEFNGAQGQRGEDGLNGVILEGGFILGFAFDNGDLVVYTADNSDISFNINTDGELIATDVR